MDVHLPRRLESLLDAARRDLVEHHPEKRRAGFLLAFPLTVAVDLFLEVMTDSFALAIRVSRQVYRAHLLRGRLQLLDQLLLAFDNLVPRLEAVLHIHREVLFRQVLDVAKRSHHDVVLPQIFVDSLRLGGRFNDYERLGHS